MVKRNGDWVDIPVKELVMGDVIALKGGDIIPADCRVHGPPPPSLPRQWPWVRRAFHK